MRLEEDILTKTFTIYFDSNVHNILDEHQDGISQGLIERNEGYTVEWIDESVEVPLISAEIEARIREIIQEEMEQAG